MTSSNEPRARKLTAAHALLVDLLSAGPVPVADCLERAAEVGISERTLYEDRRRLPITCGDAINFSATSPTYQELKIKFSSFVTGAVARVVSSS